MKFKAKSELSKLELAGSSAIKNRIKSLALSLLVILTLHISTIMYFEDFNFTDAIWFTLTTITTVGYGDISVKTLVGKLSTILLIYIVGIATMAQLIVMYFEYDYQSRNHILSGNRSWNMKHHIVFLNGPENQRDDFFYKAISGLRDSDSRMSKMPIIIVNHNFKDGIEDRLRDLKVAHVNRSPLDEDSFEMSNIKEANTIVIMAERVYDQSSDSITFEIIDRIRELGFCGRIIAESVRDENRKRLFKIGANNVIRPIRSYPELIVRTIISPGSEQIIETLFNSSNEECIAYDVSVNMKWKDIVMFFMEHDIGTPISYRNKNGLVISNPAPHEIIESEVIFTIVHKGKITTGAKITQMISRNTNS